MIMFPVVKKNHHTVIKERSVCIWEYCGGNFFVFNGFILNRVSIILGKPDIQDQNVPRMKRIIYLTYKQILVTLFMNWKTSKMIILNSNIPSLFPYSMCVCVCVCVCVRVCACIQSCLTLCNPIDCSHPGFSVRGISQGKILEWAATSHTKGSSWPRDQTHISWVSCTDRQILYHCTT